MNDFRTYPQTTRIHKIIIKPSDIYQKHIVFFLNILFTHNINTYPQISILANEAAYNHLQQRQISIKYKIIVSFQMSKIVYS